MNLSTTFAKIKTGFVGLMLCTAGDALTTGAAVGGGIGTAVTVYVVSQDGQATIAGSKEQVDQALKNGQTVQCKLADGTMTPCNMGQGQAALPGK